MILEPVDHDNFPSGVLRAEYQSGYDGISDWALLWPEDNTDTWVVFIHGHGANGEQFYIDNNCKEILMPRFKKSSFSILTPNLRGNSRMSPAAVFDMKNLINFIREKYNAKKFLFFSSSMGGTSNLIYAAIHPEDVDAVVACCPVSDIEAYHAWCCKNRHNVKHVRNDKEFDIIDEIRMAIESAYGGTPEKCPDTFAAHSTLKNAKKLTMPVYISHGEQDELIPVEQSQNLADAMAGNPAFIYHQLPGK